MKLLKKIVIVSLVAVLMVPATIVLPKSTEVVQAATIKLSKNKLVINLGASKTLKVQNTKKKVKWSSSNKKIVKVSSKGKVTGVRPGTAIITAKIGKKKLTCKVTVKFKEKNAKKKIKLSYDQSAYDHYTIAIITNNNPFPVSVSADMKFYDEGKSIIGTNSDFLICLGAKETDVLRFRHPNDASGWPTTPASYKMSYTLKETYSISVANRIKTTWKNGLEGVECVFSKKSGGKMPSSFWVSCLMYDSTGHLLGTQEQSVRWNDNGGGSQLFHFPYDEKNKKYAIPANVKIYIDAFIFSS